MPCIRYYARLICYFNFQALSRLVSVGGTHAITSLEDRNQRNKYSIQIDKYHKRDAGSNYLLAKHYGPVDSSNGQVSSPDVGSRPSSSRLYSSSHDVTGRFHIHRLYAMVEEWDIMDLGVVITRSLERATDTAGSII